MGFARPVRRSRHRPGDGIPPNVMQLGHRHAGPVREAVPGHPLMLKLRKSFALGDEGCEALWSIARGAFDAGVDAILNRGR